MYYTADSRMLLRPQAAAVCMLTTVYIDQLIITDVKLTDRLPWHENNGPKCERI